MALSQYIFTPTCTDEMTSKMAYQVSCQTVTIFEQLGFTGRVFANNKKALAVVEGPTDIVEHYFHALSSDVLLETIFLHSCRSIKVREFSDFSVWINLREEFGFTDKVRRLNAHSVKEALPDKPSAKLKIMVTAYLYGDLLVAA